MQSSLLPASPFLLLSLLFLSALHGYLASAQSFNFLPGKLSEDSLTSLRNASVDSSGFLALDATSGDAQAFYSTKISVLNSLSTSVQSFASFFTIESNVASGNGSIAFALVSDLTGGLTEARKTLTIEFNTSCLTGGPYDAGWNFGGRGFQGNGRGFGWGFSGGPGDFGGLGGFQVVEYANDSSIQQQLTGGYGYAWTGQPPQGNYFCNQNFSDPTFQYLVAIEYNASTETVWVGSPSCGAGIARTMAFTAQNLSGIITTPVYVGFFASDGGIFNITQWNFTSNTNSSTVSNLAVSSAFSTSTDNTGDGGMGPNSGHKMKKGYAIAFSILGAGIGVAAVVLVCCLCARKRRRATTTFVGKSVHEGTIPEGAVVFDAKKPRTAPANVALAERDTAPLNSHSSSAFHGSTGAATWLQPVAPR